MMIKIVWLVSDGKYRPGIGIPEKGNTYPIAKHKGDSYVQQKMAEYERPAKKISKVSPTSFTEEK